MVGFLPEIGGTKQKGGRNVNCRTCRRYKRCMERSRMYPCTEYERKKEYGRDKDDTGAEKSGTDNPQEKETPR